MLITACPEPCGLWDCAFHAHLGTPGPVGCATEDGAEYRAELAQSAKIRAQLDELESKVRALAAEVGIIIQKPGKA